MAQHPYGQPAGPGPYWQPQPPPPPPGPRSNVALIVVVVVLAVVLLLAGAGAALWLLRSDSATGTTSRPPASAATCAGGDRVTDPQYAFKAPLGWCVDHNGPTVGLRTTTINVITITKVPMTGAFEQVALCDKTTEKLGPYTKLPSLQWAGRKAETYTVTGGIGAGPVRCLVDSRYQYMVTGGVGGWGTMDEVEAGVAEVIASWTWT
jgi:hypothetical protein